MSPNSIMSALTGAAFTFFGLPFGLFLWRFSKSFLHPLVDKIPKIGRAASLILGVFLYIMFFACITANISDSSADAYSHENVRYFGIGGMLGLVALALSLKRKKAK